MNTMNVVEAIEHYIASGDRRDAVAAVPVGASTSVITGVDTHDTVEAAATAASYFADLDIAVGEFAVLHRTWGHPATDEWGDYLATDPSALPAVVAVHIGEDGTTEWIAYRHLDDTGVVRYTEAAVRRNP